MIPAHIKSELDTLNEFQRSKFFELLAWSGNSGLSGVQLPIVNYEHILKMVRQMENNALPTESSKE